MEGNKCHPFNSRRGRLKGPKNIYTIWGLNFIILSEKRVFCSVFLRRTAYPIPVFRSADDSAHSPSFPLLHLRHSSISNHSAALPMSQLILKPSVASPTSQFILQPFFGFSYVTSSSLNTPGEPPMVLSCSQ